MSPEIDPLSIVEVLAAEAEVADRALKSAIIAAHRAGFTLREIAEAAGVSHETVRTIIRKAEHG